MCELSLPESWVSGKLSDIASVQNGYAFKSEQFSDKEGMPLIRIRDIARGFSETFFKGKFNSDYVVNFGDVLVGMDGNFKCHVWSGKPALLNQRVCRIVPKISLPKGFIVGWLNIHLPLIQAKTVKVTVGHLSSKQLMDLPMPIPSLGEQKRIVAKIESAQEKIKTIEQSVTKAEELISRYREALLQKAFRGELVPQDPNDETASTLLERIRADRAKQTNGKNTKKDELPPIKPEEIPFEIPKSWEWVSLGNFSFVTKLAGFEYTKHIQLKDSGEVPVIRAQNVRKGYLDLSNLKYISSKVSQLLDRCSIHKKCLVMTFIGANIGDTAIIDPQTRHHLAPNVAKIEPEQIFNLDYLMQYLLSSVGREQVFKSMKSTAQPSLSMTTIREIFIPVPPLEEQEEISKCLISNLNALSNICEDIKNLKLTESTLQDAILAVAFSGSLVPQSVAEGTGHDLLAQIRANSNAEPVLNLKTTNREKK